MNSNRKNNRVLLASLLSLAGLFNADNSAKYVDSLNVDEVTELISALKNQELQPAQFVAAVTGPGNKSYSPRSGLMDTIRNDEENTSKS